MEQKGWCNCTLPKRLNHQADELAKAALLSAHCWRTDHGSKIFRLNPSELRYQKVRVCGSPRQALESDWGYGTAQKLFNDKGIIQAGDFHLVWWEGLGAAMSRYPKMYRVWLTKHVSDFCGNNVQLYHRSGGNHSPKCKFCETADEYTSHICRCRDPGQDKMFRTLLKELCSWLIETLGEHSVAGTIETYLLSRGEVLMADCIHGTSQDLIEAAAETDRLGWDSLL